MVVGADHVTIVSPVGGPNCASEGAPIRIQLDGVT